MKISSILRDLFAHRTTDAGKGGAIWTDDPYAHPIISAMSERERADLPPFHMASRPAECRAAACRPAS